MSALTELGDNAIIRKHAKAKTAELSDTQISGLNTQASREVMEKTGIFTWTSQHPQYSLAKEAAEYIAGSSGRILANSEEIQNAKILRDIGLSKISTIRSSRNTGQPGSTDAPAIHFAVSDPKINRLNSNIPYHISRP
jgi:hypothetical protein